MLRKILTLFKSKERTPDTENHSYESLFEKAQSFTIEQNFTLDSPKISQNNESLPQLINEISAILVSEIPKYKKAGFDPIVRFGGDCGNIHFAILNFINKYYKNISANITVGEIKFSNEKSFDFNQAKCLEWLAKGSPQILDCHTWITINDDYILDCTIGTYINTRISPDYERNKSENLFGGLIFGNTNNLQRIAFQGLKDKEPQDYPKIKYAPVILGSEAFTTLAPKQP